MFHVCRVDAPPLHLPPVSVPTRVVIVRHGQSTWNASNRVQGSSNMSELTEKGRSQAEAARSIVRMSYGVNVSNCPGACSYFQYVNSIYAICFKHAKVTLDITPRVDVMGETILIFALLLTYTFDFIYDALSCKMSNLAVFTAAP